MKIASISWSKVFSRAIPGFFNRKNPTEPDTHPGPLPAHSLKFHIGSLDDVENREFYKVGGFYPTKIGDKFHGGRYQVLHKLGYGGFATVWFARDHETKSNVAIKIIAAEDSKGKELENFNSFSTKHATSSDEPGKAHIPALLSHFWFDGPNGRHLCLVLPALGPSIQQAMKTSETRRLSGKTARIVALQATQALASLHSIGLGHGDFRPANLLFGVKGISQWSEEDVRLRLGEIVEEPVMYRDGSPPKEDGIPPTIICPTDYTSLIPDSLEKFVYLVDMGETFHLDAPPEQGLGTPAAYCAPECHFDHVASMQTDIWALACTIFEIRAGYQLFETFLGDYEDDVAPQIVTTLGKMPEPWWRKWKLREAFYDEDGKPVNEGMRERVTLEESLREIGTDDSDGEPHEGANGILSQEEVEDLADLLSKMLKYDPADRIDILTVLQHRWFTVEY